MVHSAQTEQLSCIKISTISKRTVLPLEPRHLRVPSGASKMISKPMVHLVKTMHLFCTNTNSLQMVQNEIWHGPRHQWVPSGALKMISEPVAWTNTMHLSCVKIHTISKWAKLSIQYSLVTKEYHRVRPKQFLSLWYVWRKPCTYLAPTLTLSPNGPK
jgi:hypothetical protein